MIALTSPEKELENLEFIYQPSVMGELIGRLMGPQALYMLAEKAYETGQPEGAALARALAAREKFYRQRKIELEELIKHEK